VIGSPRASANAGAKFCIHQNCRLVRVSLSSWTWPSQVWTMVRIAGGCIFPPFVFSPPQLFDGVSILGLDCAPPPANFGFAVYSVATIFETRLINPLRAGGLT
jgi:hypothetical protein